MRIIVIGGGVAGAAAALAMRLIGAAVTVYEARADPGGEVGSFVSLAANGLRGLEALGCAEAVRRSGFDVPRQRMRGSGGRLIGDVPRGRRSADPLISVTLMRARLVTALREAAADAGAVFRFGDRAVGADPATGEVAFASGLRDRADLVVAADGIWSVLRGVLDADAPVPEYAGLYTVSGVSQGVATDPGVFDLTLAGAGAFIHVRAGDEVWWAAQIDERAEPEREGVADAEWTRRAAAAFADEAVPSRLVAATARLHRPVVHHVLDEVPVWHRGRIVLIGDAAHPVGAGQGASMAIEDAVALAGAVASAPVPEALDAYAAQRRPRIRKVIRTAEDNRGAKRAGPAARRAREFMMRLFVPLVYERATGWLYDHRPALPERKVADAAAPQSD